MNQFIISGRLTKAPEYRQTQGGMMVAQFGFVVNRSYKREGEPDADFFTVTFFGKQAEALQKCQIDKGTKLLIGCEVRNNNYQDKNGNKVYSFQFIGKSFEFCESKSSQQKSAQPAAPASTFQQAPAQPSYQQQGIDPAVFMPIDEEFEGMEDLPF